jgi:hypothetical protein
MSEQEKLDSQLVEAVNGDNIETVSCLLKRGASVSAKDLVYVC